MDEVKTGNFVWKFRDREKIFIGENIVLMFFKPRKVNGKLGQWVVSIQAPIDIPISRDYDADAKGNK